MATELTPLNIATLLDSLKYSKQRVSDVPDTPYTVRLEKLSEIEACEKQLRRLRDEKTGV